MPKVLIANNFKEDSWFSMCHRLALHLAQNNEVVFMSYRPYFKEPLLLMDGKLTVYSWSSKGRPTGIRDIFHFIKIYFRHRPEIIVGHFVGANICILVSKVLSFFRVKTFEWYHTLSTQIEFDGGKIPYSQKLRRKIFFRFFSDTVVPVSELAARDYRGFYGLCNERVVLNGIRDQYQGVDKNFNEHKLKIGFIGRFVPHKGVDILMDLITKLSPDKFIFRIAGEGTEGTDLEKMKVDHVEILGMLSYGRVRDFIEECHIIIIPSYTDNLVTVGIETMMLKRCLVISNGTGLSEYLRNGEDAVIVEPSTEKFMDALQTLESDRSLMYHISSNGRNTYLERFNMEAHVKQVEEMLLRN
jgi:glycosyltransferase involved in cell wall biosynthesis